MTQALALTFVVPLALSLIVTRVMRGLARKCGALDQPDGRRKLHARPIPHWGGAAVYVAFLAGLVLACQLTELPLDRLVPLATLTAVTSGLIFLLGFADDRWDLPGRIKLILQFVSVLPVVVYGYGFDSIVVLNHPVWLGAIGIPLMLLWLVGCTNAVNLLDGMDGNASTVGVIALLTIATIAHLHALDAPVAVSLALAGALCGFLAYNLPSASIYLGDAGSTVIGVVTSLMCIEGARESSGALRIAAPLVIMTIPVLDTSLAIVRRKLSGRRFDHADRGHLHHRLLDRGLNTWQALAVVVGLCSVTAAGALLSAWFDSEPLGWLTSLIVVVSLAQLRYFGHHESKLVRRSWFAALASSKRYFIRWLRLPHQLELEQLETLSFDQSWDLLTAKLARWPTERVELSICRGAEPIETHVWSRSGAAAGYQWRLSLSCGAADTVRIDLQASGADANSHDPRYLGAVASLLRLFAQHWLAQPEHLETLRVRLYSPSDTAQRRHAA